MRLEAFFDKFELFADAPDAVAKMRELVLALAVQGKLVPQTPDDEPAAKALDACGVDLDRWTVSKDEQRQDVPSSWAWIRFASIGEQRLGKMLDAQKNRGELKLYLRNTNVQWMRFELEDLKEMRVEKREEDELRLRYGDLLVCEGGEPGRCAIWRDEAPEMYFQKALHRVRPCNAVISDYLALNLQVDCRNGVLASYFTGATIKHLTGKSLSEYPVPIPPLAEQKRIVAKVGELMALCDRLEAQQQERETRHAALSRAALARFAETPTPANLEFLFHKSYAIAPADLRKSILTLAIQGKLTARASVASAGPDRRESAPASSRPHIDLPNGWIWVQIGDVSELINGDRSKNYPNKNEYVNEGIPWINTGHIEPDGTLSLARMNYISRRKFDSLRGGKVKPEDLVYCLRGATFGKTAIITQFNEGAVASSLVIIRLSERIQSRFAYLFLVSPLGRDQIFRYDNGSAQPNLSAANVKKFWMPLPPLDEQHLIVSKVDELMALVDKLEAKLASARTTATNLLAAAVAELTQGEYDMPPRNVAPVVGVRVGGG